jgi:transcriptional regulator with XRE-family HTH domain
MTQAQLADLIGANRAVVSFWLSGKSAMPQSTAMAIGAALGIRWQWLLHGEGDMLMDEVTAHMPDDLKELAALWPRLTERERQYMLGVAQGMLAAKARE